MATVFGAGGGTSSYAEVDEADVIVLWGSNARETHPIFFHHVLRALRRGAELFVVDPRQTATAEWAACTLRLRVGGDIALANAMARVIIDEGLCDRAFIEHATEGFEPFEQALSRLDVAGWAALAGVPEASVRRVARAYARADRAMLCWTLGITEHHNAVHNVFALINLALLTGHVGKPGSGLNPLRGQNNVQGGGDMGALPHKLPGFQDVESDEARAPFDRVWGRKVPPKKGKHLSAMFEAMHEGSLRCLYVVGENPAQSEADAVKARRLLSGLDFLVVQDLFLTRTAELAYVVLPSSASFCESEGTVTNSERRVQRVRKAVSPPGGARDDIAILCDISRRLGYDMGDPTPEQLWDELRTLSPMHRGMSYERLERHRGLQWPCPDDAHPGERYLHGRLHERPVRGPRARFHPVEHEEPSEALSADYPLRLTTGRRLSAYNTGVQSAGLRSPLVKGETVDLSPADAARLGLSAGDLVRVSSRRGHVEAPLRVDERLPEGLVFMTFHYPEQADTNKLTIDAVDPLSGTAEFKAAAVRVERAGARG